jgi:hypothetical protein
MSSTSRLMLMKYEYCSRLTRTVLIPFSLFALLSCKQTDETGAVVDTAPKTVQTAAVKVAEIGPRLQLRASEAGCDNQIHPDSSRMRVFFELTTPDSAFDLRRDVVLDSVEVKYTPFSSTPFNAPTVSWRASPHPLRDGTEDRRDRLVFWVLNGPVCGVSGGIAVAEVRGRLTSGGTWVITTPRVLVDY